MRNSHKTQKKSVGAARKAAKVKESADAALTVVQLLQLVEASGLKTPGEAAAIIRASRDGH
jgi:hypothetical protein